MAVGVVEVVSSQQYKGRVTPYVILSCVVAATGGLIFGYDIGTAGGVTSMEPFLKEFFPSVYRKMKEDTETSNYCKFDSQQLTSFTSSFYVASLITSLLASPVTRASGRKASILLGGVAFLAGSALGGAAKNVYMIIFGRFLLGVGVGFTNQAVPIYLSEMAPPRYRGLLNSGFQLNIAIGALLANLVNFGTSKIKAGWGWRVSLAMAAAPAALLTLGVLFLPETPNSILQRNHKESRQRARKMLCRIRGTDDVDDELEDLIRAGETSKAIKQPFKELLVQRKHRPQLVMAVAIPFFQQATGINVIGFYAPELFRTIGLGESASLMSTVVISVVGIGCIAITMLVVDKVGRRFLFTLGGILMFFMHMVVGGIMAAELGDKGGLNKGVAALLLALICIYVAGFALSWGPLGWLVPSEIFSLEIRSAAQSVAQAVSNLFTFIIAQTLLVMLCRFKYGIFFFFGGWVMVMTGFVYFLLPETKNRGIEQMNQMWRQHRFWKGIVGQEEDVDIKMGRPI